MRGQESHTLFSEAFKDFFQEINDLCKKGTIEVGEDTYNVETFFVADYKVHVHGKFLTNMVNTRYVNFVSSQFTLLVLGLNAANANYSCAWCKVHKDQRYKYVNSVYRCTQSKHTVNCT